MIFDPKTAEQAALYLLRIQAIKLRPDNPFVWASGLHSPIYCDNRLALSYPEIRNYIRQALTRAVRKYFPETNLVAGVATAGIPQGVLVAQELALPFVYVRSEAKKHGMTNRIEGHLEKGQKAVVIEDLVSTGKSSLSAVEALRQEGVNVYGMVSSFTYALPVAEENFKKANCRLVSLSDYHYLIKTALKHHFIEKSMLRSLQSWRENPENWSNQHKKPNQ